MDTRSKILNPAEAERLPRPLALAIAYFELLRVDQVRALEEIRLRTPSHRLLAVALRRPDAALPAEACAQLAAALRMVDYVVIADFDELDAIIERLQPAEVARLESADLGRLRRLIDHVHRSQIR